MSETNQKTVSIYSNQAYALPGEALLQIVDALREEIPVKHASTVQKIENLLATVIPVRLTETPLPDAENTQELLEDTGNISGETGAPEPE